MDAIRVKVLHESHHSPACMITFLAKLTQRGHKIQSTQDLIGLYLDTIKDPVSRHTANSIMDMPHGTIKRFTPVTLAVIGASRRFLAQARTHQAGFNFVSASLQYSDYSDTAGFVVPYELLNKPEEREIYLNECSNAVKIYRSLIKESDISNDTAGYVLPQGLRNILIIQANHEAWHHFIRVRSCNRNTVETQYITTLIWAKLLHTNHGKDLFCTAGPDCLHGACREKHMSCNVPFKKGLLPIDIINEKWPLITEDII